MSNQSTPANFAPSGSSAADTSSDETRSRRDFLRVGAGVVGAAAAPMFPASGQAQGDDPELARVLGQRRILIRGGVVLSLDRQVGDFAQASTPRSREAVANQLAAFRDGLSETGYVEGRNVIVEYHWGSNQGRYPEFLAELLQRRVNVIVAASLNGALAAKAATATIPIVFNAPC
jgi:hypothetical protein